MADHRKPNGARPLSIGGRLLPRGRLVGAALALLGALAPAQAQELGLKHGTASLEAGKYESAVRQLSATVNDNDSTTEQAAKALYLRGIAYRKLGLPGRAISDLGAALWLGLSASDKARALVNKGLAYKAVGLSSQADAELSRARSVSSASTVQEIIAKDGGATTVASGSANDVSSGVVSAPDSGESVWSRLVPGFGSASTGPPPEPAAQPAPQSESTRTATAPSGGWDASVSDETATSSGNRVTRWFGSLTGDSAPAPPPAAPGPAPAPQTTAPPRTTAAPPPAESWAANMETARVVSESSKGGSTAIGRWFSRATDTVSSAPAPASAQAATGGYRVQLANSRSKAEAEALWKKVSAANQQLAGASPQIEKVDIGNFGTFYSLRIGPFPNQQEGTKVCNALKRNGTDCSVVSPDGP